MSNLLDCVLKSSLIQKEVPYRILLPDKYSISGIRYPVLYLLHGLFGSFENWTDLTDLRSYSKNHRFIIVMPEGGDNWYTDIDTGEKYESYFIEALIPEIDRRFRTVANRSGRAIAGNSMGGYGAFKFALKNPDKFTLAASFSGAFDATRLSGSSSGANWGELGSSISRVFGDPGSSIRNENDLEHIALRLKTEKQDEIPYLYFDCGLSDEFIYANRELSRTLLKLGIEHEYHEFEGGHDWLYWGTRIVNLLDLAANRLF